MKTINFLLLIVFANQMCAQTIDFATLKRLDKYKYEELHWNTCNNDSAFYKADTLIFTTQDFVCCDYFTMTFSKNRIHSIHGGRLCLEPPMDILHIKPLTGEVKKCNENYYVIFYEAGFKINKFIITELTKEQYTDNAGYKLSFYCMTLVKT